MTAKKNTPTKDFIDYSQTMADLNGEYETLYDQFEERVRRMVNAGQMQDSARVHILTLVDELVEARGRLDHEHGRKWMFRWLSPSRLYYYIKSHFETKKYRKVTEEALVAQGYSKVGK